MPTACNARRMVETAAHLADHVIPRLPVRQWVLSVPKRLLRYCARPAFALQRLREIDAERLVYESVKPGAGGSVTLILSLYCLANGEAAIVGRRQCIAKPSSRLRSGSDGQGREPSLTL